MASMQAGNGAAAGPAAAAAGQSSSLPAPAGAAAVTATSGADAEPPGSARAAATTTTTIELVQGPAGYGMDLTGDCMVAAYAGADSVAEQARVPEDPSAVS
eukprot:SAG22_NODE_7838_length_703_cov_1.428808_1_plen_100_part_10